PLFLRDQLAAQNLPCPWYGKPNSFECPAGVLSGTGWLLLSRAALNNLNLNTLYPLIFTSPEQRGIVTNSMTLQNIRAVEADCVTPGRANEPAAGYRVHLADRRHLYRHIPLDRAYNLSPALAPVSAVLYLSATLKSGQPWTWDELVQDIWNTVG